MEKFDKRKGREELLAMSSRMGADSGAISASLDWHGGYKGGAGPAGEAAKSLAGWAAGVAVGAGAGAGWLAGFGALCLGYNAAASAIFSASAYKRARIEKAGRLRAFGKLCELAADNFARRCAAAVAVAAIAAGALALAGAWAMAKAAEKTPLRGLSEKARRRCGELMEERIGAWGLNPDNIRRMGVFVGRMGGKAGRLREAGLTAAQAYASLLGYAQKQAVLGRALSSVGADVEFRSSLAEFEDCGAPMNWRPAPRAMPFGELAAFCAEAAEALGQNPDKGLLLRMRAAGRESLEQDLSQSAQPAQGQAPRMRL